MPPTTDIRTTIQSALADFQNLSLDKAALSLFNTLGYCSERTATFDSIEEFCTQFDPEGRLNHPSALKSDWKSIRLLFQLTDQELSRESSLFQENHIDQGLFRSYVFFAIELTGQDYARGKLTGIIRQINRIFPMPVMVLIKHLQDKKPVLSIGVINRRQNKKNAKKTFSKKSL